MDVPIVPVSAPRGAVAASPVRIPGGRTQAPRIQTLGVSPHGAGVMPPCSGMAVPEKQGSNQNKAGNQLERPEHSTQTHVRAMVGLQRVARTGGSWHWWRSPRFSRERKGVPRNGLCSDPGSSGKVQLRPVGY